MRKTKLGQELIAGLREAIAYERGEITLRSEEVVLPAAPGEWSAEQIAYLRKNQLKVSQPIMAAYLGVTSAALKAWEQGLKRPAGSARRLLELLAKAPEQIIALMPPEKSGRRRHSKRAAA